MSNLVSPGDPSDRQITPKLGDLSPVDNRDSPELYFQELIAQQQSSLTPTTDLDEYKKRLEIIQLAIELRF